MGEEVLLFILNSVGKALLYGFPMEKAGSGAGAGDREEGKKTSVPEWMSLQSLRKH